MIDPSPNERAALAAAGEEGGRYLDGLGRTDLAALTAEEWQRFVEVIVTGYVDTLGELAARDRARLDGLSPGIPFR